MYFMLRMPHIDHKFPMAIILLNKQDDKKEKEKLRPF